ncbi:hypothetical protein DEU56DRAFT_872749 [Suillus clintonianus]|uniref:uncharacterized protein n=1 Tax=Suillus clintonianus TaxID=1904413 RepID=UPI001B883032|nr:uncharacterized protein DEU56DRAFT_872749 [Suillus clintonianus]KAG2128012.1 hypothetical protein DEU56DRAFT_872749 [Suillus clintonianus]
MSVADTDHSFTIPTINIFTLSHEVTIPHSADSMSVVDSLLRAGYLSPTPITPTIAISLHTLEHYRLIHNRKPSFSIEAFAKVLCDSYSLPYRRRYRTIFSDAFDVYLSLLRKVEKRMLAALGRDTPNWCVLNTCPPCTYEVADEPLLDFGSRQIADTRRFVESDYLLPRDFIDTFAHDIPPQDAVNPIAADCSKHWKAAAGDEKKRMWGIFEETGIFVTVCRHRFLLWYTDMVRSGELAKYPLAIISKVIELFGAHSLGAYDISCSFNATIQSSTLAQQFNKKGLRLCVDTFHGYAHNYMCQTKHHPLGIKGAGIEDFQCAERLFSTANHVAPVTCYASSYHHHLFLDMFFRQWDDEKYQNLGTMILNNYRQALNIISTESVALEEAKVALDIQEGDLEKWREEEIEYFRTLGDEPEWDVHAMALRDIESQTSEASSRFLAMTPSDYHFVIPPDGVTNFYSSNLSQTRKAETQHLILQEVAAMEVKMAISHWWQPSFPEYQETVKYMATHKYQRVLDNLQCLMVQRLFELQRLNPRLTIRKAVEKYNEAARDIPGRAPIEWSKVTHYNFLDEFSLLRETCQDIREHPWTKPAIQLVRCNVELRRLHTAIVDESRFLAGILQELKASENPIYVVVKEYCTRCELVNAHLLARINQIYDIEGFTGIRGPGVSKHRAETMDSSFTSTEYLLAAEELTHEEAEVDLEDDTVNRDLATLVEYMTDL